MARSHPPTLLKIVQRTLAEECAVTRDHSILVAVSGGPDSMALLHALSIIRKRLPFRLLAHGVDHGLRAEAAAELTLAEQFAAACGVEFTRSCLQVAAGGNLQARARAARYSALREVATTKGADCIATAHHADDRAETVLLRLLRGSGPRGLAVLPPRAGELIRPLVRAGRSDIDAHLARHHVPFALDPSNTQARFLRVRVRTDLMPLLRELSPSIVQHLNALADQLRSPLLVDVTDEAGQPLVLSRAHRTELQRARRLGRTRVRVRLSATQELRLDRESLVPVLDNAAPIRPKSRRSPG
jgi:tRNA(Ile)-lysidine synthase